MVREREFSAAFSGGPIEASIEDESAESLAARFSAAFSGGPIEASSFLSFRDHSDPHFPLLLAAAPLKRDSSNVMTAFFAFSAAFSGGPIEALFLWTHTARLSFIFRCF